MSMGINAVTQPSPDIVSFLGNKKKHIMLYTNTHLPATPRTLMGYLRLPHSTECSRMWGTPRLLATGVLWQRCSGGSTLGGMGD